MTTPRSRGRRDGRIEQGKYPPADVVTLDTPFQAELLQTGRYLRFYARMLTRRRSVAAWKNNTPSPPALDGAQAQARRALSHLLFTLFPLFSLPATLPSVAARTALYCV